MSLVITREEIGDPVAAAERVKRFRAQMQQIERREPHFKERMKQENVEHLRRSVEKSVRLERARHVIRTDRHLWARERYVLPIVGPCQPDHPQFEFYNGKRDILHISSYNRITVEDCIRYVCAKYGIDRVEIIGERRHASIVTPRQEAMYLSRIYTVRSLPEIGRKFGGRDHTTVLHAVKKVTQKIKQGKFSPPTMSDIGGVIGKAPSLSVLDGE